MAGRLVPRHSKFRHVFGTPYKRDKCYINIRITRSPHESNMCAVNGKFLAVVVDDRRGRAFLVVPLSKVGNIHINHPKVVGHGAHVTDLAWNPFNDNQIASSSMDCTVKVWEIPDEGISRNLMDCLMNLQAHTEMVGYVSWHPCAENVLASGGFDLKIIIWNVASGEMLSVLEGYHSDIIYSMSWNYNGSLIATTCRDKQIRVLDPRDNKLLAEGQGHMGTKPSKVVFCGSTGKLFSTGFANTDEGQYAVWDPQNLSKALSTGNIVTGSGVLFPFWDEGTNMIYLCGKGDRDIYYFEITAEAPYCFLLNKYQSRLPLRDVACMPKRELNYMQCEIWRFYAVIASKDYVEPISMTVPRKSTMFQEDIYPPCEAPTAALSADEWAAGTDKDPRKLAFSQEGLNESDDWASFGDFEGASPAPQKSTATPPQPQASQPPPQQSPRPVGAVAPPPPTTPRRGGSVPAGHGTTSQAIQLQRYKQRLQHMHQQLVLEQQQRKELLKHPNQQQKVTQMTQHLQNGLAKYQRLQQVIIQMQAQYAQQEQASGMVTPPTQAAPPIIPEPTPPPAPALVPAPILQRERIPSSGSQRSLGSSDTGSGTPSEDVFAAFEDSTPAPAMQKCDFEQRKSGIPSPPPPPPLPTSLTGIPSPPPPPLLSPSLTPPSPSSPSSPSSPPPKHNVGVTVKRIPMPNITFTDLEFEEKLGSGSSGAVFKAHYKSRDVTVAVKLVLSGINRQEVEILNQLNHPNIISFYGVVTDRVPEYFIVTEFAEGGSLFHLLHEEMFKPGYEQSLCWAKDVAEGMNYLHQRKILHRDLKSANVLLTSGRIAKVCDFGESRLNHHTTTMTQTGTYRWMAPEVLKGDPISLSSDVFSYGMILLELFAHKIPYPGVSSNMRVMTMIVKGETPTIPDFCKPSISELMQRCWEADPRGRPNFEDILRDLKHNAILISDLKFGGLLGKGRQSRVRRGRWLSKELDVAIKILAGRPNEREVAILSHLDHSNVIRLFGIVEARNRFLIVTEYADGGSLYDLLHKKHIHPSPEQSLLWASEIAQGMHYLHENKILHRDLKSSKVLLTTSGTAKVCDYGSAKQFDAQSPCSIETKIPRWMAPEGIKEDPVSLSYDVFSYAMVIYELFSHELPFAEVPSHLVLMEIVNGKRPTVPATCEPYIDTLMRKCWNADPQARPSFQEILVILKKKGEIDILPFTDATPLTPSDLPQLLISLEEVSYMWYVLGVELNLDSRTLMGIGQAAGGDPSTALSMALIRWLRMKDPSPTLEALTDVLSSKQIDRTDLSDALWKDKDQLGR